MELAKIAIDRLRILDATLSIAESCTGGGLSESITRIAGVSRVFLGGVTTYANSAKEHILHVPPELILSHGAVSEEVALAMASGCAALFGSTWSMATTGISGPTGGSARKPVGTVFIAIFGPSIHRAEHFCWPGLDRLQHRHKTIEQALLLLARELGD